MLVRLKGSLVCMFDQRENRILLFDRENRLHYKIKGEKIDFIKKIEKNVEYNRLSYEEKEYCRQLISRKLVICDDESEEYAIVRVAGEINAIQLEVTKRCNFSCKHCYLENERFEKDLLSIDDIKSIIDQASDMGVFEFDITGGEPLVRSDIKEILNYIYIKGMRTRLYTNGFGINDDMISFFKSINLYCVRISIDGANEFVHNSIRCVDSYNIIIENIKKLQQAGIVVEITTIVMKDNQDQVEKLIGYLKGKFKIRHFIDCYIPVKKDDQTISPLQYASIIKCKFDGKCFTKSKDDHCGIGKSYLFIDSKGNVRLCPMIKNFICGEIKKGRLEKVWDNQKRVHSKIKCDNKEICVYKETCDGGCRARAYYLTGNINGKDEYFCYLQKVIKEKRSEARELEA